MSPGIPTRLLATQSDERLLALIREGHERAFEALVHRYRRPLLSYCRRLPLPDGRAEDVIQLALLRAWIAVREGAEVRDLKAWLYRVVHNTALNAARDAAHDSEPVLDDPGSRLHPTAAPPELDLRLRAREALAEVAALPVLQREVMVRTAVAGHSHERVASDLGISDGAVRGLLYRARATVRRAATALTPPPLLSWLAGRMQQAPPTPERLTELAGGGSVGVGGLLFKGGIVAVTASTALTGVAIVHLAGSPHRRSRHQLAVVLPGPAGAGGPTATASAAGTRATSTPAGAGRVGRVSPGTPRARRGSGAGAPAGAHVLLRRTAGTSPSGGTRRAGSAPRGTVPGASPGGGSGSAPAAGQPGQAGGSGGEQSGSAGTAPGGGSAGAPAAGEASQAGQGSGAGAPPPGGAGSGGGLGAGSGGGSGSSNGSEGGSGGSSGSGSGGETSGAGGESTGGSETGSSGGSGESSGLVGTVLKTVGGVLEHVLH